MYGQISTLAFIGIEARPVEVQRDDRVPDVLDVHAHARSSADCTLCR